MRSARHPPCQTVRSRGILGEHGGSTLSPFRQNATVTHFETSGIEGSTGLLKTICDCYRDVLWRISGFCLRSPSHLTLASTAGACWLGFSEST
jgi:hypothetical protein